MFIITINERYEQIMSKIDEAKSWAPRMGQIGCRAINQAYRFMHFDLGMDVNSEDEEYAKWILCEFFDRKYYEDERFSKRRGVGKGSIHFLSIIGKNLEEECV